MENNKLDNVTPLIIRLLQLFGSVQRFNQLRQAVNPLFQLCILSHSRSQRRAQTRQQSGRPDMLGGCQQAELGSDVLHPAGASE